MQAPLKMAKKFGEARDRLNIFWVIAMGVWRTGVIVNSSGFGDNGNRRAPFSMFPKIYRGCARWRIVAFVLATLSSTAHATTPGDVSLPDSIRPVEAAPAPGSANPHRPYVSRQALTAAESSAPITFEVALKMPNFSELRTRVGGGEHISPAEMAAKYEPSATDYQTVIDWLKSDGFIIVKTDPHHMLVFAKGDVSQTAKALKVNFARVMANGKEYTSAVTAPTVPAKIAPLIIGINGLQPHIRAHKHIVKPNAGSSSATYTPAQIAQAYQATGLYNEGLTGAGQTIAIVIDTFPAKSDLVTFWTGYGINQSINNIDFIQAVSGPLDTVTGEETLDTEWSSAMAPGAKVRVYASADLEPLDLDQAYEQVITDAATYPIHQMSMSYGAGEITDNTSAQRVTDDGLFLQLANAGVTCFASSGDEGPTPDIENDPADDTIQVESPADDPYVIGVGGTTLTLDSSNNESTEVVWGGGAVQGATGGGASVVVSTTRMPYLNRPSWQTGTGIPTPSNPLTAQRLVPDIACAADPNFGADYYYTDPVEGLETAVGGTSWASPTCAGFCALINQARANLGLSAIGQAGPKMGALLYPLILTANFRSITSGNNSTAAGNGVSANSNGGYNAATGIGVPLVQTLTKTLAQTQNLLGVEESAVITTVNQGVNATISVTASGSPSSYQWQRMPIGMNAWTPLSDTSGVYSGSATSSLTIINTTTAMSGDQFECVVTYAGTGNITSNQSTTLIVENPLVISTLAGDAGTSGTLNGTGTAAEFNYPSGIAVDSSGNLYVTDLDNNQIRKVTPAGVVTTPYGSLAGTSGSTNSTGNNALFNAPRDITIDSSNNLYVSDEGNNLIRKINTTTGEVTSIGTTASPAFNAPRGIAVDTSGNVYVADSGNNIIRKIATNGVVTILAGSSAFTAGYADGAALTQALFNEPIGLAVDGSKNVYVTEYNNVVVRKISSTGTVSTLAGQVGVAGCLDGTGSQALFNTPRGIMVDGSGNLYLTDSAAPLANPPPEWSGNNLLRKITSAGVVTTLAGQGGIAGSANGTGSAAQFYNPVGVAINSTGGIYVADASNDTIRLASPEPVISLSATLPYASALGPAAGQITVSRTGSTVGSVTANYLVGGTAVSNIDYSALPLPNVITIPSGSSSAAITVTPLYNSQATANRTVQLTLTGVGAGYTLNSNPATVTLSEAAPVSLSSWQSGFPAPTMTIDDGISSLLKYTFDIDPSEIMTSAAHAALPTSGMVTVGATNYLTLSFREYAGLTGTTVHVQTSSDLLNWAPPATSNVVETGIDANTGDPLFQVQVPITGSKEFVRLKVTQP